MPRRYVEGDEVIFTQGEFHLVNMKLATGECFEDLEPKRLFPISGLTKYISLLDKDGKETAIIRDIETLMPESRAVIEKSLEEYYLIPEIISVLDRYEKYGILKWTVQTDRGVRTFEIKNRNSDIKALFDGRVLIRDRDDNRYEIPDVNKLDAKSLRLLNYDL
mgnify:CR=1 FL=1